MAELDLIRQLDQAVDAMMAGVEPLAGPELGELLAVAADLRHLPGAEFRARLRGELLQAVPDLERRTMMTTATDRATSWVRPGFHTLTPYLHLASAAGQIDFLKRVFGAEELGRYPAPDGSRIMHAEVRIGDSMVEMGEAPQPRGTPLHVYIPDVDAVYQRAIEAGAAALYPPTDHDYGERGAGVKDAEGNHWYLATARGPLPANVHTVNVYLSPQGAPALIDFLKRAFDVEEVARHESGGAVVHARLRFGDSVLEMGEAHGQWQPMPCAIHYYVSDVDESYRRALAAGAESVIAPRVQAYGARLASVRDSHGNEWYLATHNPSTS